MGFPGGSDGKESSYNVGDLGPIPGWEGPLEEGIATHFSILAWRIPMYRRGWGGGGELQTLGLQRVGHD